MTAPTAEALEQRAREVWDSMRPLGSAFWDELPPLFRDQLTRLYAAGVAAERERAPREQIAQIIARAYGGSLHPGLGVPGDYPTDDPDYCTADAILALSEQPVPVVGWRDIASAPRDGSYFLAYNGHWTGVARFFEPNYEDDPVWVDEVLHFIEPTLTHWQPLPAAPAPSADREDTDHG